MSSLPSRHSNCHQAVTAAVDATATIWVARTQCDVAPAANQHQESSRRVRYLRATVKDSNFCKALLFHDFRNRVARESLRRGFGTGSSFLFCVFAVQTSSQKTPRGSPPGVFAYPPFTQRFASDRVAFRDSPFRERPTGVRKEPSRSLPHPRRVKKHRRHKSPLTIGS
jgi:hypothetical protein